MDAQVTPAVSKESVLTADEPPKDGPVLVKLTANAGAHDPITHDPIAKATEVKHSSHACADGIALGKRKHVVLLDLNNLEISTAHRSVVVRYVSTKSTSYLEYQAGAKDQDLTGLADWSGSALLGAYLLRLPPALLCGKRILELGCGCAGCGLIAATDVIGASSVVMTDYSEDVLALAQHNITLQPPSVQARLKLVKLDWSDNGPKTLDDFDIVLGSELLYYACDPTVLLRCATRHLRADGVLLLFSHVRDTERFEAMLAEAQEAHAMALALLEPSSILDWVSVSGMVCTVLSKSKVALAAFSTALNGLKLVDPSSWDDQW